jgi:glycosyltransferase involved in cell wall biosynthesis
MIPRVAHFVFGLEEQREPFHFLRYVSIESCRRVLEPERIRLHCTHLPWGPWWERIRPHVEIVEVDLTPEVLTADYSAGHVPARYRYAHHADVLRLDALIEHGGIYADIDTIFLRPFPERLFRAPFVLGREPAMRDEVTGELRPSVCNALLLAEPGAAFARAWRERIGAALNGTWSNHSGFLAAELASELPDAVRVEDEDTFFPVPPTQAGLARLLEERHALPASAVSVHLWEHLWWERGRVDFTDVHAGDIRPHTTLADLVRPYLPRRRAHAGRRWTYVSLDGYSGYAVAAARCVAALEESEVDVEWRRFGDDLDGKPDVVVAHLVPEHFPAVRERFPDAFLVGHTVWETDRAPAHWRLFLDEADLIVVPSRLAAESIAPATGRPVAIVPHAADCAPARPSPAWTDIPLDTFVFYTIAEWTERKAVFRTLEAYLEAFTARDPVQLVVKTSARDRTPAQAAGTSATGPGTTAWAVAHLLAKHRDPPPVRLVTRALTNREVAGLHHRGDCFVSLCRSEGWGLGAFDAATHGNPVVTTGHGGHLDHLGDSPYLVDFELVPVRDSAGFPSYAPDQRWAEPNVEHGAELLRRVVREREEAQAHASARADEIKERYRPAAIASAFRAAVEELRPAARAAAGSRRPRMSAARARPPRARFESRRPGSGC